MYELFLITISMILIAITSLIFGMKIKKLQIEKKKAEEAIGTLIFEEYDGVENIYIELNDLPKNIKNKKEAIVYIIDHSQK